MKQFKLIAFAILISLAASAQRNMYIVPEIEGGVLTTDYTSLSPDLPQSILGKETSNYALKFGASFVMAHNNNFYSELGISQTFKFWTLEGSQDATSLKVTQKQNYPSVFGGLWYEINLKTNAVNLQLYMGSRLSIDFLNYNSLNDRDGDNLNYVISKTEESNKIGFHIIPEIGIKGIFDRSENTWQLGVKYYQPLGGNVVEGTLEYFKDGNLAETITYENTGQMVALSFRYGFNLRR